MNEYPVVVGWADKDGNRWDGYATIYGNTFEEAREELFQQGLKEGIRYGFIELRVVVTFVDLNECE